jgi:hypothetical protein
MRRPSNAIPGRAAGLLPVAIRMRFVAWRSVRPSCVTSTASGPAIRPVPVRRVMPCFLNSVATPPVSPRTTSSLRFIIAGRSSATSARMPCAAKRWDASENSSLESSSALLGMQPTFRHVPPSVGYFSIQAVFMPSWAARIAATYPADPDPMTIRSYGVGASAMSRSSRLTPRASCARDPRAVPSRARGT